ncbi:outer membrane efflux protein TolC [Psychroflexus gondwanensis ACAM 44]|jgi:outer membrane protein TolC|uniref:Outer membrane efflux protein TolC n=1 Tax=Psychroflexus gondwanensis ACAM 44 TaxID=1189619 RepID=N1WKB6_9FLAO|nr:TolC family protein [Psychroflexus gondwanensis]EMY80676.1 outer membrane efflux protein TolC [Psychroflexus gondwanensis ACAM 44]
MKKLIFSLIAIMSMSVYAQDQNEPKSYRFTLQEAIDFAIDSSYATINARRDVAIALKQKWETTADGLPQIDGGLTYEYNPIIRQTPLPAELVDGEPGTFIPVEFSPRQNMNASVTLNQIIFDGSYIVALQAAKTFLEYSDNNETRTKLEVRKDVVSAYGNVLLTQNSIVIVESNLETAKENLRETRITFENGLAEEEDVEQLQITYQQLQSQLNNAKRMEDISKESLNMVLGLPISTEVELLEDLENLANRDALEAELITEDLQIENTIQFKIADNLVKQRELEMKLEKSKALPSLSAFANYGQTSFGENFEFFSSRAEWFEFSTIGVSLNVPLFSSLQRSARTQKAKIEMEKAETQKVEAINQINLQLNNAKSNFEFAVDNYELSKDNLKLAERIERKNQIKFKEGVGTSFELRQAQLQLYTAQNELLQSMLDIINSKAEIEKIINTPFTNFEN